MPPIIASGEIELFLKLINTLPFIDTSPVTNNVFIVAVSPTRRLLLKLASLLANNLPFKLASPEFTSK